MSERGVPVIERRPIEPIVQKALTLVGLPLPPSAGNSVRFMEGGRSRMRRYRAWRAAASWQVRLQNPRRVRGPVAITIEVEDETRSDLDRLAQAPIDLLCELNLIEGDHRSVIREVCLRRGAGPGMRVDVRPLR